MRATTEVLPKPTRPASGDDETSPGVALPLKVTRVRRWMFAGAALVLGYACALLVVASLSADLGFLTYQGAPVILVDPDSPAAAAGLQLGDQIVAIDGRALPTMAERQGAIDAIGVGDLVTLTVKRGAELHDITYRVPRRVPIAS